ncbi:MAG: hypothetical protein WBN23_15080 [Woeseia sp.]
MSFLHRWFARLRGKPAVPPRQSVLAFDRYEEMTATQALRFEDLQRALREQGIEVEPAEPEQPWYSLEDAGSRTGHTGPELLTAAAAGRLQCFVYAQNAAGYWDASPTTPVPASVPDFLALPASQCREVLETGGANVRILEFHHSAKHVVRYRLKELAWVGSDTLYLQHPLPGPGLRIT